MNSGVFFDSIVILPNAGSELVIEWFEERMAYADQSAMQFCYITLVPAGVDINQREWTKQAVCEDSVISMLLLQGSSKGLNLLK